MNIYLIVALLAGISVVLGYQQYQERQRVAGIEITVGDHGISIDKR